MSVTDSAELDGDCPAKSPDLCKRTCTAHGIEGLTLADAVSAALVHRERTGKGQMVEMPMLETINSIEILGGHAFFVRLQ